METSHIYSKIWLLLKFWFLKQIHQKVGETLKKLFTNFTFPSCTPIYFKIGRFCVFFREQIFFQAVQVRRWTIPVFVLVYPVYSGTPQYSEVSHIILPIFDILMTNDFNNEPWQNSKGSSTAKEIRIIQHRPVITSFR